jgi:hypothetical protein
MAIISGMKFFSLCILPVFFLPVGVHAQKNSYIDSFRIYDEIKITIDQPQLFRKNKPTIIVFYALPNGNTTDHTMGKKMQEGDDWHFDIQHIRSQTAFVRQMLRRKNFIVIYLENRYLSWPAWKRTHPEYKTFIPHLVDSLSGIFGAKHISVYLNGHSGGGSFIFGYLDGVDTIPGQIKRISFLDSHYGYDSRYADKLKNWLKSVKASALNVFAYNDSVALLNGKPVVSATGGTWYRGHLMLSYLQEAFSFSITENENMIVYKSNDRRIQFYFKTNPERKIYHTQQVELNGFIHSVLCGTRYDSKNYSYYSERAYNRYIE